MSNIRLRKKLKEREILVNELEINNNVNKKIINSILKAFNKSEEQVNKIFKLALGDSYWTPNNIKYIYSILGMPNKFNNQIAFIFNAINIYLVYAKLPTNVLIFVDTESRNTFLKAIRQLFENQPAPLGLYILLRAIMNDTTFSKIINKVQFKFVNNFLTKLPLQTYSELGLRTATNVAVNKFLTKKIKMNGGKKKECKGVTKKGLKCKNKTLTKYCKIHVG